MRVSDRRIPITGLFILLIAWFGPSSAAGPNDAIMQQATQQMIDAIKEADPQDAGTIDTIEQGAREGAQQLGQQRACFGSCTAQQNQCTSSCGSSSGNRAALGECLSNCNQAFGACSGACN
jgi:hypothetical protein